MPLRTGDWYEGNNIAIRKNEQKTIGRKVARSLQNLNIRGLV